ncbi:Helix-turn-helix domain-containing protein [Actinomadura madurae]|uniref:Helix-turn-helix domain-containing protein n=2 Tax=Actinomadura madurae TaxID=1993 RepID=A0A1I5SA12_9ACTN|nr:Helix-turn-helix domain-containing protein [Actinomadura madurae]
MGLGSLVAMSEEVASQGREPAGVEHELSPSIVLPADARLRPWVARDHEGFDEAAFPRGDFVDPATLVTVLAVKVTDQPWHPPVLVNAPSTTFTRVQGPWAPAIVARLAPLGAYKLLGPALSEISGSSYVALEDIVGAEARRLGEQVQSAPTWDERRRLLNDFLLDRATRGPQPSPEVTSAWHLLVRSGGRSTITSVARQVGWSHKHLITRFKQQVGVTPQMAARLVRLSTVWRHLDHEQSWGRIAAESGYADQAHLIREFRHFTGTTPAALTT